MEAEAYDKWETNPSDPSKKDSLLEVTIRADRGVNAGYIHKIYKACEQAKIFKVKVAANQAPLEP